MESEERLTTFLTPIEGPAISLPQLPSSVRPPYLEDEIFQFDQLIKYDEKPVEYYKDIIASLGDDPLPEDVAKLLFFSSLTTHAITKLVFSPLLPETFLYTYISSPIIEYLPFIDSLRTIFSRISLPYQRNDLLRLLVTISRVERERCGYAIFGQQELTHIIASIIYVSIQKYLGEESDLTSFMKNIQYHTKLKAISPKFVQSLYNSIKNNPIELSYSFSDPLYEPNLKKKGFLSIPKFSSWNKKICYAELDNHQLLFYKDETRTRQIGGIPLANVIFKHPLKGETENSFTILSEEMKPTGFTIDNKGPVLLTETLVMKTNTAKEMETWRSSITHNVFVKMFASMIQLAQWK